MPSVSETFIGSFYSLDGLSIGERRRNFYRLLNDNDNLETNPTIVDEIVKLLKPRTFLEELFKVDLLIYYRRSNELFDIVKDGNEIFISKIVKHLWFFEQVFNDFDAKQLVNEILPCTSYSARMKILKKLSKCLQGERFDRIFDALLERYGQFIAHKFLLGCSSTKIEQILKNHQIKLSNNELMMLYKMNPQLISIYFEENYYSGSLEKFLKYLFVYDLELYNKLYEKHRCGCRVGKRLTRRVVYSRRNDVIESPDYYKNKINIKTALRKLRSDSRILLNNIPIKHDDKYMVNQFINWIKLFPSKYQWKLFKEIIMNRYELDDFIPPIDENLVKTIDNSDDRLLIVKRKILDGHERFIKYLNLNESIPMLKEKINLTSRIEDRKFLLGELVATCHFHNDMDALCNIVKFFVFKHRNDDEHLQIRFLRTLKNTFGYHNLNDEIWTSLHEIFEIHKLKFDHAQSVDVELAYIEYLFNTNRPVDDELLKILEKQNHIDCFQMGHNNKFRKYLLMFCINNADKIIKLDDYNTEQEKIGAERKRETKLMKFDLKLLSQIEMWNRYNPDDKILFLDYPRIVNNIKLSLLKSQISSSLEKPLYYIIANRNLAERNECLGIFWKNLCDFFNIKFISKLLSFLLKYDVIEIQNHVNQFVQWCFDRNSSKRFWYKLKKFTHLQFDVKLLDLCLNDIETYTRIEYLSVIISGEKYQQLADKYSQIPSKKLDLKNEEEVRLYELRCRLAKSFKHTKYPKAIHSVLNYCVGDYLGSALTSLYSFMYHLPENQLEPILKIINERAVSCRKHALFLACELCDYSTIKTIITLLNQTEGSQSLQKRLIKTTIRYLKKNPNNQIFELVKLNIQFTNKNDDDLLDELIEINELPHQFVPQYAQFIWDFLDIIKDDRPWRYKKLKGRLLSTFTTRITEQLPLQFCQNIVEEHFLKPDIIAERAILGFILNSLSCDNKRLLILQQILKILEELESNDDNKRKFLLNCYNTLMLSDSVECLQIYVNYWEKLVDPIQQFTNYVKIFFVKLKISALLQSMDIDAILVKIVEFLNDLIEKYTEFIINFFANIMDNVIKYFINDSMDEYDYYERLLSNYPNNINVVMVVIEWLPVSCPEQKRDKYWRIRHKLETIQEFAVPVFYKIRFEGK